MTSTLLAKEFVQKTLDEMPDDVSVEEIIALVPNLQIGNLESEALASRNGKLELPTLNSQAGAWELANKRGIL